MAYRSSIRGQSRHGGAAKKLRSFQLSKLEPLANSRDQVAAAMRRAQDEWSGARRVGEPGVDSPRLIATAVST